MELRYWILLIVLGAIWGSAFIFIKIATPELGSILVSARLGLASLIFLPILYKRNIDQKFIKLFHIFYFLRFSTTLYLL